MSRSYNSSPPQAPSWRVAGLLYFLPSILQFTQYYKKSLQVAVSGYHSRFIFVKCRVQISVHRHVYPNLGFRQVLVQTACLKGYVWSLCKTLSVTRRYIWGTGKELKLLTRPHLNVRLYDVRCRHTRRRQAETWEKYSFYAWIVRVTTQNININLRRNPKAGSIRYFRHTRETSAMQIRSYRPSLYIYICINTEARSNILFSNVLSGYGPISNACFIGSVPPS
jgi:hypothetical protein